MSVKNNQFSKAIGGLDIVKDADFIQERETLSYQLIKEDRDYQEAQKRAIRLFKMLDAVLQTEEEHRIIRDYDDVCILADSYLADAAYVQGYQDALNAIKEAELNANVG